MSIVDGSPGGHRRRVLVTGATGFIGHHLVGELVGRGHDVSILARSEERARPLASLGVRCVLGDLGSASRLEAACREVDVVFHLAGLVRAASSRRLFEVNAEGTRLLSEICAGRPVPPRLVFVSSLAAAGPAGDRPVRESDPPRPVSDYGRSKLEGERAVRETEGLPWSIVRPPGVYGPGERDILVFFRWIARGILPSFTGPPRLFSLVRADDLARGIADAGERDVAIGKTYFLADPDPYPWPRIVEAIAAGLGRRRLLRLPVPGAILRSSALAQEVWGRLRGRAPLLGIDKLREALQPRWTCETSLAARELAFRPRQALEEGIAQTARWYRAEGWIR